ncbi:MAG: response regulator [Acidobacteriota bacterium]|nr:response regulator [Acidobacteriota bacterium]
MDHDDSTRDVAAAALAQFGITCDTAANGAAALELMAKTSYCVVVVNLLARDMSGAAFVRELVERGQIERDRPVVLMAASSAERGSFVDLADEIHAVIQKPVDVAALAEVVRACVESRRNHDRALPQKEKRAGSLLPFSS